jgi:hypothetical protein
VRGVGEDHFGSDVVPPTLGASRRSMQDWVRLGSGRMDTRLKGGPWGTPAVYRHGAAREETKLNSIFTGF